MFTYVFSFYRAKMHSADYAVARRLSVRLSVRHTLCVSMGAARRVTNARACAVPDFRSDGAVS